MYNELTIIYYHEIVPAGEGYSYQKIEIDKFETQMRLLRDCGYTTLYFSEISETLPSKPVIVSFDDGFRTVFNNAAPIMLRYGIKGNVYLPTAYIGTKPQFMNWDMVNILRSNFEFQAHTHSHSDIRSLSKSELIHEIELSDSEFLSHLGYKPSVFCIPFGAFDRKSVQILRETHRYNLILGSFFGSSHRFTEGSLLPRIGISNQDTLETFKMKLEGKYNWKGSLQRARLVLQNIKGERITDYHYD